MQIIIMAGLVLNYIKIWLAQLNVLVNVITVHQPVIVEIQIVAEQIKKEFMDIAKIYYMREYVIMHNQTD